MAAGDQNSILCAHLRVSSISFASFSVWPKLVLPGVAWTGVLNSRRVALGLKVDWAYAPGEVKILTSSDGANFEEAKCWQSNTRAEVAFDESFMFDAPRHVKAVSIVMRGLQPWGYFGINSAALIAEPAPFMLVR